MFQTLKDDLREDIQPNFLLCDIKEGEVSLSHIWKRLYKETQPLPAHLDFRMEK